MSCAANDGEVEDDCGACFGDDDDTGNDNDEDGVDAVALKCAVLLINMFSLLRNETTKYTKASNVAIIK